MTARTEDLNDILTARLQATLLDALGEAVIATDPGGRIRYWNRFAERLYGWRAEEVLGRNIVDVTPSLASKEQAAELLERLMSGESWSGEFLVQRRDGSVFPARVTDTPVVDDEGNLVAIVGISADVSDRHRAKTAQRLLDRASAELAESLDPRATLQSIARIAVESLADGCAIYLARDDGALELAGVDSGDPTKLALVRELHERFPLPPDASLGPPEVIRSGRSELNVPETFDSELLQRLGRDPDQLALLRRLEMYAAMTVPMTARGRTFGAITLVLHGPERRRTFDDGDVTLAEELGRRAALALDNARLFDAERRAREEAEEAKRVAEEANRAKASFLTTMSHELRTPLNAIAGYAELIELGVRGPVTEEQREDLRRIKHSQQHLLSLINDVLNFAKLEAGRVDFDIRPLKVAPVLATLEPLIEPQLRAKGVAYECVECAPDLFVTADLDKLRQILINLLSNAVKFTPEGGRITVSGRAVGERILVDVRDTGVGIAAANLDRIFDAFVQVDRQTNSVAGTGLGLAISRDLARGMGGDVTVESAVGVGSTFTLVLPRG